MKLKTLIPVVAVLIALAGLAFWLRDQNRNPGEVPSAEGRALLQLESIEEEMQNGASIEIQQAAERVLLVNRGERWVIGNRENFPADSSKIGGFLLSLVDERLGFRVASTLEGLRPLGLLWPEEQEALASQEDDSDASADEDDDALEDDPSLDSTFVTIRDKDEAPLFRLIVGRPRATSQASGGGGRYVRLGEATEGYLSSGALSIDTEAADWVERLILVLPKNELHALILGYAGEKPLRIDRNPDEESKVEWVLTEGGGKDQILEPLTLNKITTRLADLEFEELADGDVEEPEKDQLRTLDAIAKDGRRYRIELNMAKREGNLHAMTIRASTDETANARAQEEAEAFNASFAGQTYFVRPHQLNGLTGEHETWFKPKPKSSTATKKEASDSN